MLVLCRGIPNPMIAKDFKLRVNILLYNSINTGSISLEIIKFKTPILIVQR
jgi:hypothetical protein